MSKAVSSETPSLEFMLIGIRWTDDNVPTAEMFSDPPLAGSLLAQQRETFNVPVEYYKLPKGRRVALSPDHTPPTVLAAVRHRERESFTARVTVPLLKQSPSLKAIHFLSRVTISANHLKTKCLTLTSQLLIVLWAAIGRSRLTANSGRAAGRTYPIHSYHQFSNGSYLYDSRTGKACAPFRNADEQAKAANAVNGKDEWTSVDNALPKRTEDMVPACGSE